MKNKPIISQAQANLYKALTDFTAEEAPSERIDVVFNALYSSLLANIGTSYDRKVDPNKTFEIRESDLNMIYTLGRLMVHLVRIEEAWTQVEKEVSHE